MSFLSIKANKHIPRILGLGLFLQQIDAMILNTAIPKMAESLGAPTLSLKLAITSYLLTLAMFIPISGYVADRFGTQKIFSIAMMVFLLGSVLCGFAFNIEILILGRLIQGAGAAMITPVGRLILLKTFSKMESLIAFTAYTTIGQIGLVLGPSLGGMITTFINWRFIFFINVPVVLVTLYWVSKFIPNYLEEKKTKFDWLGFWIFGAAAGAVSFGFSWLAEESFFSLGPWILLGIGGVLSIVYYLHAINMPLPALPSLDLKLFRFRTYWVSVLGGFIFRLGASGVSFLLPLQLQILMGYSAFESGLIVLPNACAFLVSKQLFQPMLRRYGFKKILITSPIVVAVSLLGYACVGVSSSLWFLGFFMVMIGFASSIQYSALNTIVFADVPNGLIHPLLARYPKKKAEESRRL